MKHLFLLFSFFVAASAQAASSAILAPNLNQNVTGTSLGAGHYGLDINGSITATNPSVGTNASTAPTSSTQIGFLSGANLVPVSSGNPLPVLAGNASIGATGSAVPSSATFMGVKSGANIIGLTLGQAVMAASLPVTLASDQSALAITAAALPLPTLAATSTLQSSTQGSATGGTAATASTDEGGIFNTVLPTLTNGQQSSIQLDASGRQILGTSAATIGAVGINAGVNLIGKVGIDQTTPGTTNGVQVNAALPIGANTIGAVNQGTANTVANGWPVKITDGTSTAAVKAASTAAVAADPAQVVALSPNNNTLANALFTKTTDGTNTGAVKAASTAAVATDPSQVVSLSPNNNTLANALITKLSDGTNTAAVKAASTAAIATDPAVVVAISPNNGITLAPPVTGSGSAAAATVSTVITATAPGNATGFILQCLDTSTANIRWAVGRTATATLGQQLQPGRDTGFVPIGASVSIVAESGTQNYDIQWIAK